ncbi:MAG TPA: PTS sugar transporter subunit IIA [Actinomycetota bacterium]|jgi:mannitol/fructose-specific phosphotransferase system IIA component|nr:PTS sugar transporter subunit IIA [Actinomycetota bacterium]
MPGPLLSTESVRVGIRADSRREAIQQAGKLLVEIGAVEAPYVDAMQEREESLSSYVGEGFALPHGTDISRKYVKRPAVAFLQYPGGIDWEGEPVQACIAIAARSDEHTEVMARLAQILLDADRAELLRTTTNPQDVVDLLEPENTGAES